MNLVQKNILYNDNAVVDADASYAKHGILSIHRVRKEKKIPQLFLSTTTIYSPHLKHQSRAENHARGNKSQEPHRHLGTHNSGTFFRPTRRRRSRTSSRRASRLSRSRLRRLRARLSHPVARIGTVQSRALTRAIIHEFPRTLGHSEELRGGHLPVVVLGRALARLTVHASTTVTRGILRLSVRRLEEVEVAVGLDLSILDVDDAETVGLDGVLVGETSGVNAGHLGGEKGGYLTPLALGLGASVLGEENGAGEVLVGFDFAVPGSAFEGLETVFLVAPGVVVEGEEIGALVLGTAVEVEGLLLDDLGDVSGGVANGDLAGVAVRDVLLHVAGDGLNVGRSVGVVLGIDNFVAGEEEEKVVVVCELVDSGED